MNRTNEWAIGPAPADTALKGHGLRFANECFQEIIFDALVNIKPLDTDTQLAGVTEARSRCNLSCFFNISVRANDHGVLATEFKGGTNESLTTLRGNYSTNFG